MTKKTEEKQPEQIYGTDDFCILMKFTDGTIREIMMNPIQRELFNSMFMNLNIRAGNPVDGVQFNKPEVENAEENPEDK